MKYKVGDKFRMVNGGIAKVEGARYDVYKVIDDGGVNYVTNAYISHQIISEITDELIDRFRKEKIAWHFKNKEDYSKMLYLLSNKGIGFHFAVESPEEFFDKKKDFCLNLYSLKLHLQYGGLDNHIKDGYEIIEIMNPVYVPKFYLPCGHYETTHVWVETSDGKRLTKPMYKGIDCELLFQQYMQQKKIPDLEKKVENQRNEIQGLNKQNTELKQRNKNQKFVIVRYRELFDKISELLNED